MLHVCISNKTDQLVFSLQIAVVDWTEVYDINKYL